MSFLAFLIAHEVYELVQSGKGVAAGFGGARVDFIKDGMIYGCVMLVVALLLHPSFMALFIALLLFCARVAILLLTRCVARGRGTALKGLFFHEATHALVLYLMARLVPEVRIIAIAGDWLGVSISPRTLFVMFSYIVITKPSADFVNCVLDTQKIDRPYCCKLSDEGAMIGIVERIVVFTLGWLGQYTAIGFVIAAKATARIEKCKEDGFAERYLTGTLMSIGISVLLSSIYGILPA